ncbi:MAG: DUF3667 domain-containing protein [Hyphomonadaceae bacterium]
MSGEIEAAGAAVTAGLVAGAIERGGPAGEHVHGACPNCGAELHGEFCSACGQPAHLHRTLGHMVEEFLHGILHFDTRAWRTLPLLVFRPGTLTREYIHGKRARYISPLAMFLLLIFTMFAVFAFAGGASIGVGNVSDETHSVVVSTDAPAPPEAAAAGEAHRYDADPKKGDIFQQVKAAYEEGDIRVNTGVPFLDDKIKHKLENPELAFYKVQNAAYKFAFLLVPISLPFVWLLFFWKRGLTLFDHTVYILYSLSFVSLLFIVMSLMSGWPGVFEFMMPWLLLSIPVHAYFQMKGGYSLGWFSALWRTPVLMMFATFGLTFFLIAIILLGLTG